MRVVLAPSEIADVVHGLAELVSAHHPAGVVVVPVLNGALPLAADFMRALSVPVLALGTVRAESYRGTRAGELGLSLEGLGPVEGCDVILVDEIADSGRTLDVLADSIRRRGARVRTLALLARESCTVHVDYVGRRLTDSDFVVGYGLDFHGRCREVPGIVALESDERDMPAVELARLLHRVPW